MSARASNEYWGHPAMSERRFRDLQEALIRHGVAVRYAKRAALEMEAHYRDLLETALARGETSEEARRSAHEAIGTDSALVERFASRKELRSWSHRWPAGYALAPLLSFGLFSVAVMVALVCVGREMGGYLHHVELPAVVTTDINVAAVAFFLWVLPIAVAAGFGLFAYRERISLRWPVAGILLLCAVAALLNVSLIITGGTHEGVAQAGIGFSTKTLPTELARALIKGALALTPLAWMKYRSASKPPSFG